MLSESTEVQTSENCLVSFYELDKVKGNSNKNLGGKYVFSVLNKYTFSIGKEVSVNSVYRSCICMCAYIRIHISHMRRGKERERKMGGEEELCREREKKGGERDSIVFLEP